MSDALLELRDLRVRYALEHDLLGRPSRWLDAVDGVSLSIAPGESLGLIGESGCGKSSLARAVLRLTPVHAGAILFDGRDLSTLGGRDLRRARRWLQLVPQDPLDSLDPRMTASQAVEEPLRIHGLATPSTIPGKAAELLAAVGLDADAAARWPHGLSGGQRQRVCIARALALSPRLIVCDEPLAALDVSVQAQVANLLADLRRSTGLALLFISHQLALVRRLCDRTAVMYLGRVVESGPTRAVFSTPRHPYTRFLLRSQPPPPGGPRWPLPVEQGEPPSHREPPAGCRFHPRCPHVVERCRLESPPLGPYPTASESHVVACHRADEPELFLP